MWEINIKLQFFYWLLSVVLGGMYCLFYDFFRAVRLSIKCSDITVFIQDILYFSIISITTFYFLLATTNGQVRGFVIFGAVIGFVIARITVSYLIMKIYNFFLKYITLFLWIKKVDLPLMFIVVKNKKVDNLERITHNIILVFNILHLKRKLCLSGNI
jgi:hypothetical protein